MSTKYGAALLSRPPFTNFSFDFLAVRFLVRRQIAVVDHLREHPVARLVRPVDVALGRRIVVRRADDPAEKRRFARRQFVNVLAEIGFRRLAESANRKAAAIAEIDVVRVELEDLLLREALVDLRRHQTSLTLRRQSRLVVKKNVRATCMSIVLAPCALRPSRTSARAAPKTRITSSAPCSKKRLSSAASTA